MADVVINFFEEKGYHPLVAFVRHFDVNNDYRVDEEEFCSGMRAMEYDGDCIELFKQIDRDGSGFITLNEIDHLAADLWASFKAWCCTAFSSADEMEARLGCLFKQDSGGGVSGIGHLTHLLQPRGQRGHSGNSRGGLVLRKGFNKSQFIEHSVRNGWYGGNERILFAAMDAHRQGMVTASELGWFPKEKEKNQRRSLAAAKIIKMKKGNVVSTMKAKIMAQRDLKAFTHFLKRKYGNLFKAWRLALDREGTMSVPRKKFFMACRELSWSGDINGLWHALDSDDSGTSALEELAPTEARTLGIFKRWMGEKFGGAKQVMRALNHVHGGKLSKSGILTMSQFVHACQAVGFPGDAARVFELMDWESDGRMTVQELMCLDKWPSPADWLLAEPNEKAAEHFRDTLHRKYKHFVKAWCVGIDTIGAGKVTWIEFKRAADRLHFKDDVAGCWAAMDEDGSGYITLKEIDPASAIELAKFRCFAHDEFGSVLLAFEAWDQNSSGSLSMREFHRGLTSHGFKGDAMRLFTSLDFDESGRLSAEEVAFLDEWTLTEIFQEDCEESEQDGAEEEDEKDDDKSSTESDETSKKSSGVAEKKRQRHRPLCKEWPRIDRTAPATPQSARLQRELLVASRPRSVGASARGCVRPARRPLHEEVLASISQPHSGAGSVRATPSAWTLPSSARAPSRGSSAWPEGEPLLQSSALLQFVGWSAGGSKQPPPAPCAEGTGAVTQAALGLPAGRHRPLGVVM